MILRGRIVRRLVLAFAVLALLALVLTLGSIALVRVSHDTLMRVTARAEIAALSARIRSESLTLTDIARSYIQQPANAATQRALFDTQTQLLDTLVQQAIAATDLNDVEESIRISQVRQNLIAFTSQAGRVLAAYDAEDALGPQTDRALTLLIENYQQPLIQALREFEQLELDQVQVAQAQADRTIAVATAAVDRHRPRRRDRSRADDLVGLYARRQAAGSSCARASKTSVRASSIDRLPSTRTTSSANWRAPSTS